MQQIKEHPEWKELMARFANCEYGTFIPHEKIESIINKERKGHGSQYYTIINRWKKSMLEESSRQVECENSKGYLIIKPDEFRKSANRQIKFGYKRMRKAGNIVKNAPVELLSEAEQKKIGEMSTLLAQIIFFSKATLKKVKEIDKKTDQLLLDVGKALDVGD